MRISDWSSDVCSSDLLALARLGVVLEELSHDRLGLLLDLLHEALVGLVGSTRVVLDQVGEGTGRDHRADLLLVSQYGFEFALIGGHGGLAHAMASLTSDAMSKSQAFLGRVSSRSFMVSFLALPGSSASDPTTSS